MVTTQRAKTAIDRHGESDLLQFALRWSANLLLELTCARLIQRGRKGVVRPSGRVLMHTKLATTRRQVLRYLGLAGATLMSKTALADSITRLPRQAISANIDCPFSRRGSASPCHRTSFVSVSGHERQQTRAGLRKWRRPERWRRRREAVAAKADLWDVQWLTVEPRNRKSATW